MWKLVIEDDEGRRTIVPLTRDQYSIGRKDGNTIRLTERNVSREHARLFKKANGHVPSPEDGAQRPGFVLEDLTSYNGVFVNGLRISHAQDLSHGDLVQIGDYRIILQDETLADVAGAVSSDAKQTLPNAPQARAASLMDRPNRLVMLAGPTPGAEFPLDRERMTVGRAEDASISVNHNSVSRLHCEVHALGDGRFEIVDKGSSNGVRVNSSELRRGIVEPGDVIELGDVKFKFVGAGQIFRPTESQQLALLGDRDASELVGGRRGSIMPVAIFLGVVLAGGAAAWVWARPRSEPPAATQASAPSADEVLLEEAKRLCLAGDCEPAHEKLASLAESSPSRASSEFRDLETRWADQVLARAELEPDSAKRRGMYQRVAQETTVDSARRKTAADKLQQLDAIATPTVATPLSLPSAATKAASDEPAPPPPRADAGSRRAAAAAAAALAEATPPAATPTPMAGSPAAVTTVASAPRSGMTSVDDRERQLALQGTQESKMLLKQQLEQRVYSGRANDSEIKLLISTCKDLGDKLCVQQARSIQQQRQQ